MTKSIVSFIVIENKKGEDFSHGEFERALQAHVGKEYDRFARPDEIYVVEALPKTLSAKVPRKAYRKAYQGEDVGDLSSVDNPQVFDTIRQMGEERRKKRKEVE